MFRLVLEDAIVREEEAYRFYEAAAEAARLPDAVELLKRLCAEELRHRVQLEELQSLRDLGEVRLAEPEETAAAAPPETGEGGATAPQLQETSSPEAILEVALRKELEAVRYYEVLSRRGPLRAARVLFRRLRDEERRHVDWVRRWQAERPRGAGNG